MDRKTEQLDKERRKALGDLLIAECKSPHCDVSTVANYINAGADVLYKNNLPLYFAAKGLKFGLIKFLIENGALKHSSARNYIASMCQFKGFNDETEKQYFELLDEVLVKTGRDIQLFAPYINSMAVTGRLDKLVALKNRYGFTDLEVAGAVYVRIIFEIIVSGYNDMLGYINSFNSWINQASFDLAVAANEWMALEYFIEKTPIKTPSDTAVGQALFEGSFEVLTILEKTGYDFKAKPLFLEKACRAVFSKGTKSLEFLLSKGYKLTDKYKGKTLYAHALEDNNAPLVKWLEEKGINT